ncbi:MAG: MBL fold metallo-hydrolase [Spirochaetaceae bacterium]|nr:MBL fold metallo-hydrolase [Spirochaetaceae bacterium]
MKVLLLGTGTSHGVPVIGCECNVCLSKDVKDTRTRSSCFITANDGTCVLIDVGPDFRQQALRYAIKKIDGLFLTHSHADHLHGLDDLRIFASTAHVKKGIPVEPLPIYGNEKALNDLKKRFSYVFNPTQEGGGKPIVACQSVFDFSKEIAIGSLLFQPIPIKHGNLDVCGWLVREKNCNNVSPAFAYITDCSFISEESKKKLRGVQHLVIDGLRERKHETHFSFEEAIQVGIEVQAQHIWLTHICHDFSHEEIVEKCQALSKHALPAYDGLTLEFG